MDRIDNIIVGSGIAGLTLAYDLSENGKSVLLIEKESRIGGLAKSFIYEYHRKKFIFDIGPKRFHTDDTEVSKFIKKILTNKFKIIGRKSSVYLFKKYFNWPITIKDIFKLPLIIQYKILLDILHKIVYKSQISNNKFSSYIINKYGSTLYHSFFKNYTNKFLKIPVNDIHSDWAKTGIDRSIIDKRIKSSSFLDLIRNVIVPSKIITKFIYPKKEGFGYFCSALFKLIRHKVKVITSAEISSINDEHSYIIINNNKYSYNKLIWTGNLNDLNVLLKGKLTDLKYLSTVFYNIVVKGDLPCKDQWIYFGDNDLNMIRVSISNNFAKYLSPPGYTNLVVEKTCFFKDALWSDPKKIINIIKHELTRVKLLDQISQIDKIFIEKVKDTYPIYDMRYRKNVKKLNNFMARKHKNILLLGRSGSFWYNNADHSIKAALHTSRYIRGIEKTPYSNFSFYK